MSILITYIYNHIYIYIDQTKTILNEKTPLEKSEKTLHSNCSFLRL